MNKYSILVIVLVMVITNIIAIPHQMHAQPSTQGNAITGIKVGGHPYAIAVDPKTNIIFVAGMLPKKIFTIDSSSNRQVNTISLSNTPAFNVGTKSFPNKAGEFPDIAVSATAGLAFFAYSDSETLHIIDASQGYVVTNDTLNGMVTGLDADPDPNFVSIYAVVK